ncbi:MAG: hypothetical protein DU489_06950 [Nitrosomonas sp.]|uniref:hypothetical protein n=1 Tax=Nitrosomonas sp. TaxID=42353 RepID=UPI0032EF6837
MESTNEIEINGVKYVTKSSIKNTDKPTTLQIIILQRGWVIIGRYREEKDEFIAEDSKVLRVWGTTKGLGELALEGPTANTKMDDCGTVRSLKTTIVARLDVDETKWSKYY